LQAFLPHEGAAVDTGETFMGFVLCYWPGSHRLESLADPSGGKRSQPW